MINAGRRMLDAGWAAMARLKRRSWKWWAGGVVGLFVLEEVARGLATDWTLSLLQAVGRGLRWLTLQPVGFGGLFLIGFVLLLFGISFWETRPRRRPGDAKPSDERLGELIALNSIRVLFRLRASEASELILIIADRAYQDGISKQAFSTSFKKELDTLKQHTERLRSVTDDDDPGSATDARSALLDFHTSYMEIVGLVHGFEKVGVDLVEDYGDPYRIWEKKHGAYLESLQEAKEHAELKLIRGAIENVGFRDASGQRYGVAYGIAFQRLQNLTTDEEHFLSQFCHMEAGPPWGADTLMPNKVYQAGEGLVADKVLTSSKRDEHVIRFMVPEPTRQAWIHSGPNQPRNRTVDLDLSSVAGTRASGGGSTRSARYL